MLKVKENKTKKEKLTENIESKEKFLEARKEKYE